MILTFGEMLMRLSPPGVERFKQTKTFDVQYGGAEANVAVALSNFGADAAYLSKVPENDIGQSAVNTLRTYGVNTGRILRGGDRLGIYFLEKGASQRPSRVVYDRAYSAFALAKPQEFNWDVLFEGVHWFHFSGISPALGADAVEICMQACKKAKEKGITVSCDLNYRKNLWSLEDAGRVMKSYMPYIDVLIANQEQIKTMFGMDAVSAEIKETNVDYSGCKKLAEGLFSQYPNLKTAAITLRGSVTADVNFFSAALAERGSFVPGAIHKIRMVDRVGSGDAFCAGLIYGLDKKLSADKTINFAIAAGVLKHSIEGDFFPATAEEVEELAKGSGNGSVQR